jgi:hypothetical protein
MVRLRLVTAFRKRAYRPRNNLLVSNRVAQLDLRCPALRVLRLPPGSYGRSSSHPLRLLGALPVVCQDALAAFAMPMI